MTKKEAKSKYNKIKKSLKKDKDYLNINNSIDEVKKSINSNFETLEIIQSSAKYIVRKNNNLNPDKIIESLPAENLRELSGDFSKKITFNDIKALTKMHKETENILENQSNLQRKYKILNIELLQKQIELLLNDEEK